MNKIICFISGKKNVPFQIINSIVWAAIMIITSLLVNDLSTNELLVTIYIAGWFATTFYDDRKGAKK